MIPLRDINPTRRTPVVTYGLIAINALVWAYQVSLSDSGLERFVLQHGMVPYHLSAGHLGSYTTVLSSMFMHGGWLHVIFNMWSLFIFGDNVEDRLGRARYVAFYVGAGVAAAGAQFLVDPDSRVPMVGASGAIAGVLAGYLRMFPRARVVTLIPIFIFFFVRELPAALFIGIWFLFQLLSGVQALGLPSEAGGGIAFWAHIGGFVAGLYLVARMQPPRRPRPVERQQWH